MQILLTLLCCILPDVILQHEACRNCCPDTQSHSVQVEMSTRSTNRSFKKLITERDDVSPDDIYKALCNQEVELVFTAHPTQVLPYTVFIPPSHLAALTLQTCVDATAQASASRAQALPLITQSATCNVQCSKAMVMIVAG